MSDDPRRTNSRFNDLGNGLVSELIATQTLINYSPQYNSAKAIFEGRPFIKPGAIYLPLDESRDQLELELTYQFHVLPVDANSGLRDPITNADLSQISYAGMQYWIKYVYDKEHNKRARIQDRDLDPEDGLAED